MNAEHIKIDWHGHRDMGNDVGNAMTAIAAGADRVHTVAGGIGERAGNTPMEAVLLNLHSIIDEAGLDSPWDMSILAEVLNIYHEITKTPLPTHGPLGTRSNITSLGIHTAAMLKAETLVVEAQKAGQTELANKLERMARTIYTALDPELVGKGHEIHVGPWSGPSTVRLAYLSMGGDLDKLSSTIIDDTLSYAKNSGKELTPEELNRLLFNGR